MTGARVFRQGEAIHWDCADMVKAGTLPVRHSDHDLDYMKYKASLRQKKRAKRDAEKRQSAETGAALARQRMIDRHEKPMNGESLREQVDKAFASQSGAVTAEEAYRQMTKESDSAAAARLRMLERHYGKQKILTALETYRRTISGQAKK